MIDTMHATRRHRHGRARTPRRSAAFRAFNYETIYLRDASRQQAVGRRGNAARPRRVLQRRTRRSSPTSPTRGGDVAELATRRFTTRSGTWRA